MNTTLHRSTIHPPDIEDRTVLELPAADELRELALADRLSLKIGLWLLQRAQRPRRIESADRVHADTWSIDERLARAREESLRHAYWHQRQML